MINIKLKCLLNVLKQKIIKLFAQIPTNRDELILQVVPLPRNLCLSMRA